MKYTIKKQYNLKLRIQFSLTLNEIIKSHKLYEWKLSTLNERLILNIVGVF